MWECSCLWVIGDCMNRKQPWKTSHRERHTHTKSRGRMNRQVYICIAHGWDAVIETTTRCEMIQFDWHTGRHSKIITLYTVWKTKELMKDNFNINNSEIMAPATHADQALKKSKSNWRFGIDLQINPFLLCWESCSKSRNYPPHFTLVFKAPILGKPLL